MPYTAGTHELEIALPTSAAPYCIEYFSNCTILLGTLKDLVSPIPTLSLIDSQSPVLANSL